MILVTISGLFMHRFEALQEQIKKEVKITVIITVHLTKEMEFPLSEKALVSLSKYGTLLIVMFGPIAGYASTMIKGVVHKAVLLPCHGSYRGAFRLNDLVVNWQRIENDHVVHSFYNGKEHPEYQATEFKGRTQLFPEEFPEGKAFLLLQNLRLSDAGRYICHYIMDDDDQNTIVQEVDLQVQEEEMQNADTENEDYLMCILITIGLLILIVCALFTMFKMIQRKQKLEDLKTFADPEELAALSRSSGSMNNDCAIHVNDNKCPPSTCVGPVNILNHQFIQYHGFMDSSEKLSKDPEELAALSPSSGFMNKDCAIHINEHKYPPSTCVGPVSILNHQFIQYQVHVDSSEKLSKALIAYKERVHRTRDHCCKSTNVGEKEADGCLPRSISALLGKMFHKCSEDLFGENKHSVQSEDLFTEKASNLTSQRMLIAGEAGMGKSCFSKGLQKHWAAGENAIIYECIIYIPFSELNNIKETSVQELLGSKCPELSEVLTDLLEKEKVLLILDGLDEFNFKIKDKLSSSTCDMDTFLDISTLVSKIISMKLLPNTDVLVASRMSSVFKMREYFSTVFILEAFTKDQIEKYFQKFMAHDSLTQSIPDFITKHNLSSMASIPLLSRALCEIHRKVSSSQFEEVTTTCSRMMLYLLEISLSRKVCTDTANSHEMSSIRIHSEDLMVPKSLSNDVYQLCKISYKNVICGLQEIRKCDLVDYDPHSDHLFKNLSEFFFIENKDGKKFEYRHSSLRDMFAALYCVQEIENEEQLEECLDAWVFGQISENKKSLLLSKITSHHWKKLQSFIRFFFGLLPYGNHSLMPYLTESRKKFLSQWFQACIKKGKEDKMTFLNLMHCIFELHDEDVTTAVSQDIKNVNFFNILLNSLDIYALKYSCKNSMPDVVDLRLCQLGDNGLEQLQDIIKKSREAKLSSNNLTEKSGTILRDILEHENCAIEELSLGTNFLGNAGTVALFRGLEKNRSLRILSLKDNNIDDLGIESIATRWKLTEPLDKLKNYNWLIPPTGYLPSTLGKMKFLKDKNIGGGVKNHLAQSMESNLTLQELHLCMNMFGEKGMKTIEKIKEKHPELKLLMKIAEDEEVLRYAEEKVENVMTEGWKQYGQQWLQQLLIKVLKDLETDANTNESVQERVVVLKRKISQVLQEIDPEKIQDCNKKKTVGLNLQLGLPETTVAATGPGSHSASDKFLKRNTLHVSHQAIV